MKTLKRSCVLAVALSAMLCAGCDDAPPKVRKYIETPRGLIKYSAAYCELGMLVNNDRVNIRDENDKPITCSGYIKLTDDQALARGYTGT